MTESLIGQDRAADHNCLSLELVQLLVSRLLHDVSGAAGALANGAELAAESVTLDHAVRDLMTLSAASLVARVRLLGMAFGRRDDARNAGLDMAAEILRDYLRDRPRLTLEFPEIEAPQGFASLLCVLGVIAAGALPRGGEIKVAGATEAAPWRLIASGPTLRLEPEMLLLLGDETAEATTRTVIAAVAAKMAASLGWRLTPIVETTSIKEQFMIEIEKSGLSNWET